MSVRQKLALRARFLLRGAVTAMKASAALLLLFLPLANGCATRCSNRPAAARQFDFVRDTFVYSNELVWEYRYDTNGKWTTRRREIPPSYFQHCFVVSRSACQFFENAAFHPELPQADEATYRRLVRRLIATDPRKPLPQERKIVFPGYPDLRSFSQSHEQLLKAESGGAWQCYVQRGNWRMIFPFSRHQQEQVAAKIKEELHCKGVAVVHLVRFPQLSINHAVLIFAAKENPNTIGFLAYDPNEPASPVTITFDCRSRTFSLPANAYFQGGRVDVYPIYDRLIY